MADSGFTHKLKKSGIALAAILLAVAGTTRPAHAAFEPNSYPAQQFDSRLYATLDQAKNAAMKGDGAAAFFVGEAYYFGLVQVSKNYDEAYKWYAIGDKLGNSYSQTRLGEIFFTGNGVPVDYSESFRFWQKAYSLGNPIAAHNIAILYNRGLGVEKNKTIAEEALNYAAEHGTVIERASAGCAYLSEGMFIGQEVKIERWLKGAADEGNANGIYCLSGLYFNKYMARKLQQDCVSALHYLKSAERLGVIEAKVGIVTAHFNGCGEATGEYLLNELLLPAAERGSSKAKAMAGWMLAAGVKVPQDIPSGVALLKQAAEMGSDEAKRILSDMQPKK